MTLSAARACHSRGSTARGRAAARTARDGARTARAPARRTPPSPRRRTRPRWWRQSLIRSAVRAWRGAASDDDPNHDHCARACACAASRARMRACKAANSALITCAQRAACSAWVSWRGAPLAGPDSWSSWCANSPCSASRCGHRRRCARPFQHVRPRQDHLPSRPGFARQDAPRSSCSTPPPSGLDARSTTKAPG